MIRASTPPDNRFPYVYWARRLLFSDSCHQESLNLGETNVSTTRVSGIDRTFNAAFFIYPRSGFSYVPSMFSSLEVKVFYPT